MPSSDRSDQKGGRMAVQSGKPTSSEGVGRQAEAGTDVVRACSRNAWKSGRVTSPMRSG